MKRTNVILAASLIVFAAAFAACQKNETIDPEFDYIQDDDEVSALYDDVENEADEVTATSETQVTSKSSADFAVLSDSGSRTVETTFSGDTTIRTITFENFINGISENGHIKNGTIIVKTLGSPLQTQFEKIITHQNFSINGILIEGERVVTKTADYEYSVVLTGGKVTLTDGTIYTREFTHTRTWVSGFDTPLFIWDDIYTVEGTAYGTNRKGYAYTHTIHDPLVIKNSCRWIVEGSIELIANEETAVLDYGLGECDNLATITKDGNIIEIALKGKR